MCMQKISNDSSNRRYPAILITIRRTDNDVKVSIDVFKALRSL